MSHENILKISGLANKDNQEVINTLYNELKLVFKKEHVTVSRNYEIIKTIYNVLTDNNILRFNLQYTEKLEDNYFRNRISCKINDSNNTNILIFDETILDSINSKISTVFRYNLYAMPVDSNKVKISAIISELFYRLNTNSHDNILL